MGNATVTCTCTNAENKSAPACTSTMSCSSAVNTCTTAREGHIMLEVSVLNSLSSVVLSLTS